MALPKLRLNEGSLLRRSLLHVATFLVGSFAFVGIASLILCSVAKGLVGGGHGDASSEEELAVASTATPKGAAPYLRPDGRAGKRAPIGRRPGIGAP